MEQPLHVSEAIQPIQQEEIDLLDILVTLAENIKLLILGPLLVGICALGIAYIVPQTFESIAVLKAEQATASLMTTASVLDPVAADLGLTKVDSAEEARKLLREQIKVSVGRNDKLLTLTVSAPAPQQAQAIANAVLQQTYVQSRPKGSDLTRLEIQLKDAKARTKSAEDAAGALLKRLGWSVETFDNARAMLQRLEDVQPASILLDISMPDMGGESACAHIRARSEWNAIRVIAYTAHAMSEDADRFRANGFNAVLIKPITLASLTQAMGHPEQC